MVQEMKVTVAVPVMGYPTGSHAFKFEHSLEERRLLAH
jgi:hypothetical protein